MRYLYTLSYLKRSLLHLRDSIMIEPVLVCHELLLLHFLDFNMLLAFTVFQDIRLSLIDHLLLKSLTVISSQEVPVSVVLVIEFLEVQSFIPFFNFLNHAFLEIDIN